VAQEPALRCSRSHDPLRHFRALSVAPLCYSTAFSRVSGSCLYRRHWQRLRTNLPVRRSNCPLAFAGRAQLVVRENSPGRSLDVRVLLGFFGLGNLTAIETVVPLIPKWMPLGAFFWAVLTGVAFVLAGLSIISGVQDVLAARLLGTMLLVFGVLALTPPIFAAPRDHVSWGANAFNLTAVGAAWIVAGWLAERQPLVHHQQATHTSNSSLA
jgi:hypothetical protein